MPTAVLWLAALLVALAAFRAATRTTPARWWLAVIGVVLLLTAWVLVVVTPAGVIDVVIAPVAGVGAGLVLRTRGNRRRKPTLIASGTAVVTSACVLAGGLVAWVGANDPTVQWFGNTYVHGPRDGNEVAITFDDGPNSEWSMPVARILDEHGVKGTFFEVGKAIDARPDIAQALYADGHLLGNHSYHHDYWRWLDPRYPELDRTEDAFRRHLGVCPALFRPPHGQRTPFMLAHVHSKGMHAVTWDVSADDWSDNDGARIARRILDNVKPGSIILLHDSIDGNVDANREVIMTALPLILDGLEAKGLHPVRLDELLDLPAYLNDC